MNNMKYLDNRANEINEPLHNSTRTHVSMSNVQQQDFLKKSETTNELEKLQSFILKNSQYLSDTENELKDLRTRRLISNSNPNYHSHSQSMSNISIQRVQEQKKKCVFKHVFSI